MTFEDLESWQRARQLVSQIYSLTRAEPLARDFGLSGQIQRAAVSVMSNVAEGFERNRLPEFLYFLRVAKASCGEVRSQLYAAFDEGYVDENALSPLLEQATEVCRIIRGLENSLTAKLGTRHSALGTSCS